MLYRIAAFAVAIAAVFAVSTAMTCTDNGGNTALSTSFMMEHLTIIIGK